jgi:hypothetical protein
MKKLILIFMPFLPVLGFSQFEAGEYMNTDTAKIAGESIIYPFSDSTGQFHFTKMRDPSEDLDGVNLRTLFARLSNLDSLGLLVSDMVSGNQNINAGETQIYFPSAFDSNNVTVIPFVRRISDDAVIDYSINNVDSLGFDVVVWENNIKLSYIASQKISHSSDIFGEPKYAADSSFIKTGVREWNAVAADTINWNDVTTKVPYTGSMLDLDLGNNSIIADTVLEPTNARYYGAVGDGVANDTEAIQNAINQSNKVYLSPGVYLVDSLVLRSGSYICGDGYKTKLFLRFGKTKLLKIENINNVTIKDIYLAGGVEAGNIYTILSSEGTRVGIYLSVCDGLKLDNVSIKYFDKAGISLGEGDNHSITNINVYNCYKGIDVRVLSEYSFYNNINVRYCKYGVYLVGGNNYFTNTSLETNNYGLYMKRGLNDTHGSFVSSSFNHNTDYAIYSDSIENGEKFIGCHVFSGDIKIVRSYSIQFTSCYLSPDSINIIGYCPGGQFIGNIFKNMFTKITRNKNVDFIDFYTNRQYGGAITDTQFYLINDRYKRKHFEIADSLVTSSISSSTNNYIPQFNGTSGRLIKSSNIYTDTRNNIFTTGDSIQIGGTNSNEGTIHLGSIQKAIYNDSRFLILGSNFASGIRFDNRIYGSSSKIEPYANAMYDFGSTSYYWKNIYSSQLITTGNVGIGTTNPLHRLEATNSSSNRNLFNFVDYHNINRTTIAQATDSVSFSATASSTGNITLKIRDKAGNKQFQSDSTGFGIGNFRFIVRLDTLCSVHNTDTLRIHPKRQ